MCYHIIFALFCFVGCAPNYELGAKEGDVGASGSISGDDDLGDVDDGGNEDSDTGEAVIEDDFSEYDGANLVIFSPRSGDFIPFGESAEFEAVIFGTSGYVLPFDDIIWNSDLDSSWNQTGASFENDSLKIGTHSLRVEAELPNGDRLNYSVGGVLVQHQNAGTYVGNMRLSVSVDLEGIPIGASCIGGAVITVDQAGENATGESTCYLDLLGYLELELRHKFEYEIDEASVDGDAIVALDFVGFDLPYTSFGLIDAGELGTEWSGELLSFADFEGTLAVERISRSVGL